MAGCSLFLDFYYFAFPAYPVNTSLPASLGFALWPALCCSWNISLFLLFQHASYLWHLCRSLRTLTWVLLTKTSPLIRSTVSTRFPSYAFPGLETLHTAAVGWILPRGDQLVCYPCLTDTSSPFSPQQGWLTAMAGLWSNSDDDVSNALMVLAKTCHPPAPLPSSKVTATISQHPARFSSGESSPFHELQNPSSPILISQSSETLSASYSSFQHGAKRFMMLKLFNNQ